MSTKTLTLIGALAISAAIVAIAVTGGDEEAAASETDGAFVAGMVPHHESAIEMARVAQQRAEHREIRELAAEIIATQSQEIERLESIHERLYGEPTGEMTHGSLGLDDQMMGMAGNMGMLQSARQFDLQFIDMMIAHHQGAIRMAQIELAEGEDAETLALAEEVIDAQASEIAQMNRWRAQWYGSRSPAGGVPDEDETMGSMEDGMGSMPGMDH